MGDLGERRFLIVAGEPSGDAHAARLVRALRRLGPCAVHGVAGPALRAVGVTPIVPMEALAVLGFSEIIARLPALLRARRQLLDAFQRIQPHAVILVDFPGFNLRLGPQLKARGARVAYYIAPQVWAWHPERAAAMARWVDRLLVVFPFELPLFEAAHVPTTFVGHPLLDDLAPEVDAATFRTELGIGPAQSVLGLLPGSRAQEVERLLGPMLDAARLLCRTRPQLVPVVAAASEAAAERMRPRVEAAGARMVTGRTHAVQAHATACAVASGTATLETALFGTPLVVVYRVGALNYWIARRVVTLDAIGLPNIVAGERIVPELIQSALTPQALADLLASWLDDPAARERTARQLAGVRQRLGTPGASERAAREVWSMVG